MATSSSSSQAEVQGVFAVLRASRPRFRNGADKVAFCLHALMLFKGYKLVAVGDDANSFEKGEFLRGSPAFLGFR